MRAHVAPPMLKAIRNLTNSSRTVRPFSASTRLRSPIDMEKVNTTERLSRLRDLMRQHKVDVYSTAIDHTCRPLTDTTTVVPSEDSHQSEYIAPTDARRGWHIL